MAQQTGIIDWEAVGRVEDLRQILPFIPTEQIIQLIPTEQIIQFVGEDELIRTMCEGKSREQIDDLIRRLKGEE